MNNYDIFCISSWIHGQTVAKAQLSGTSSGATPWNWPPSGIVAPAEPEPCCLWCNKKPLSIVTNRRNPLSLTWLLCVVEGISETNFLKEKSLSANLSLLASPHISCLRTIPYFIFPRLTVMKQYGYLLVLSSPDYVSIFSRFLSQLLSTHLLVSFQMFAKISDRLFILLSTYLYSCMLLPSSFLYCRLMGIQGGNFLCTVYYF